MALSTEKITALAPDQASLKAANKLTKVSKWPALHSGSDLVWGECQGSGANPYRSVFDATDFGYKCTCPSRKFPCKHVLALMWMYVDDAEPFSDGSVPQWVTDWLSRRRKTTPVQEDSPDGKSLAEAQKPEAEAKPNPKAEARKKAAAEKRAQATQEGLEGAVSDLEQWLDDQMRAGMGTFLNEASERCRTIAARLVDSKAQALASRLDELPAYLMSLQSEARLDALIQEFGRLVLICRAWVSSPNNPELRRLVATSETRESLLENLDAPRHSSVWEVVGERISTRRDGLVSQETWLLNLGNGPQFALLLDFFPASLGKRTNAFGLGERFAAELAFYPARAPLRAVLAKRDPSHHPDAVWPTPTDNPMTNFLDTLTQSPWISSWPLLLPSGQLAEAGETLWWQSDDELTRLPVSNTPQDHIAGLPMIKATAIWNGISLSILSSKSDWGLVKFDE